MTTNIVTFYPKTKSDDFISSIYKKREYHLYKIPQRKDIHTYDDLKELRNTKCKRAGADFQLLSQQKFLSNFITPETPYNGLLIFHGTGVGKTCAAIQIAEQFKTQIEKYNTKIYIVVSGPVLEQNFKDELLSECTGDTYMSRYGDFNDIPDPELKKAKALISQYYEIITYKKLLRKVLGERIRGDTNKFIRDEHGKIIRDISVNRITSLSNTIIIVDEAHNISDNDYGKAIKKLVHSKASKNLRLVLLTATPMRNLASDIVFLMNLIRPADDPILVDKIFKKDLAHTYKIKIKPGGIDYFKRMTKGYISYLRGADPLTFASRNDMGTINKKHTFTKLIRCKLYSIQLQTYNLLVDKYKDDPLAIGILGAANIVLPDVKNNTIVPRIGNSGIEKLLISLKHNFVVINKILKKKYLKKSSEDDTHFLYLTKNNHISGSIFKLENLQSFSTKYYEALKNINKNVINVNDPGTSFVYSRFISIGIHMFEEILQQNGYIDYFKKTDHTELDNVRCYYCGVLLKNHKNINHIYHPATYISLTGEKIDTDDVDFERRTIIDKVFNQENNSTGQFIKIILGSSVLAEGISMNNIKDVHILDAQFTLTQVDQIIGRAIRYCSHFNLMNENNKTPKVDIYKYAVSLNNNELTEEEEIYRKAEYKYITIKKIERAMKEVAIDCPLNYHGNVFKEEISKHKTCEKTNSCPAECDFKPCEYKCDDKHINKYWDKTNKKYIDLNLNQIDYNTFNPRLMSSEITFCKHKIKELYRKNYAYALDQIIDYIKDAYPKAQLKLFDKYFLYKALTELTPTTENDFNTFKDIIYDKFNRECYLIQRGKFYILQQFNLQEDTLMGSRTAYDNINTRKLSLQHYIYGKHPHIIRDMNIGENVYEYDDIYYNSRSENDIVGIIIGKQLKHTKDNKIVNIFNIRIKKDFNSEKGREKDLPTNLGANCLSKSKNELNHILNSLKIKTNSINKKNICKIIMNKLLDLEKNSKGTNKKTYIKIPINHSEYRFPYNIEDRTEYLTNKIKIIFSETQHIDITIKSNKLLLTSAKITDDQHTKLIELGGSYVKHKYVFLIS